MDSKQLRPPTANDRHCEKQRLSGWIQLSLFQVKLFCKEKPKKCGAASYLTTTPEAIVFTDAARDEGLWQIDAG